MVPFPTLLTDLSLLRLGFVLLGSVVSRLCSRVQLLGGQVFGNSVCYEFISPDCLTEASINHFEENFRQLCSDPPLFRVIQQPRANAIVWAESVGQSFFARILRDRFSEDVLQMVELDGRYDYVGGSLAKDPCDLRHIWINLERGFSSYLRGKSCYRLRAVFPACSRQRRHYLRKDRSLKLPREAFFHYDEAKQRALPLEKGASFLTCIIEWMSTVFQEVGFRPVWFETNEVSISPEKKILKPSFFLGHIDLWEIQGRQEGWSVFNCRYLRSETFVPSSAWGLFQLEFSHVFFASVFCTKQGLVLELRKMFRVLQRLSSSLGLSLSFCCVPSADLSLGELLDVWNQIGLCSKCCGVGKERAAGYSWEGLDDVGRSWPLGCVRFAPLSKLSCNETGERLWWISFEPLYSLEGLIEFFSSNGVNSIALLPRRVHLFTSREQCLPVLARCAHKLEQYSLCVQWDRQVKCHTDLIASSADREYQCLCVQDELGEFCFVWRHQKDQSEWKKEQFVDFSLRNQMSLLVEAIRRK